MINTTSKHGRSAKDCDNLVVHLEKPDNEFSRILEIGNSSASDLRGVIRDMEILRDASSALSCLHHITTSPALDCSEEALLRAANLARLELDPADERPYIIIVHGKARQNSGASAGAAARTHAHTVLGNVNGECRALDDFQSKIKTELAARVWEHEMKSQSFCASSEMTEPCGLGRHHKSILKILRARNLDHVANWMIEHHGENPEKPVSAMSARTRQATKRKGLDIPSIKTTANNCWLRTREIGAFRAALAAEKLEIVAGKKVGVWIICDLEGNAVGSVDRILKLKRPDVQNLMENADAYKTGEERTDGAADGSSRPQDFRSVQGNSEQTRRARTAAGAARPAGLGRNRRSSSTDRSVSGIVGSTESKTDGFAQAPRFKARLPMRIYQKRRVLTALRTIGWAIFKSVPCSTLIQESRIPDDNLNNYYWFHKDIWGIPPVRPPPP